VRIRREHPFDGRRHAVLEVRHEDDVGEAEVAARNGVLASVTSMTVRAASNPLPAASSTAGSCGWLNAWCAMNFMACRAQFAVSMLIHSFISARPSRLLGAGFPPAFSLM
jgi:hypothetical protein